MTETEERLTQACAKAEAIIRAMGDLQKTVDPQGLRLTATQRGALMAAAIQSAEAHRAMCVALNNLKFARRESTK